MSDVTAATWRALGTNAHLLVLEGDLVRARSAVAALLEEVDLAYSRFRSDSELSRLNAAAGRPFVASRLFAQAIESSIRAGRLSDGLVDPTVGRAMRLAGYDDDFSRLGQRSEPLHIRLEPVPGWQ
ncbi:MAG: FAD:protein FMN transferase, partial [Candidatus Limnocylindrales bacterium]